MKPFQNIFACLVHEREDCVIDLVRNLRHLDPQSKIILYNGGDDHSLLTRFPFDRYGVIVHPAPKKLQWGWLHEFALDIFEYAHEHLEFDTITIVDSDQLLIELNYTAKLDAYLSGHDNVGMLVQTTNRQGQFTTIDPAKTFVQEKQLWEPLLRSLPGGLDSFLYWTFWPSTVFTNLGAVRLLNFFRHNELLHTTLAQSKVWASEEVLFPTFTKALGLELLDNPCSYQYVKFRQEFSTWEVSQAVTDSDAAWMHPVPRDIKNLIRRQIAKSFDWYDPSLAADFEKPKEGWVTTIIEQTKEVPGWLSTFETEFLCRTIKSLFQSNPKACVVELGSYCGKASAVIGLVAQQFAEGSTQTYAIDSFTGEIGAADVQIYGPGDTLNTFLQHIGGLGLRNTVIPITSHPQETVWLGDPIHLLLVDALHDYLNVAKDFFHFEPYLADEAIVLFHDYSDDYPGVKTFVHELVNSASFSMVSKKETLIALKKNSGKKASISIGNQGTSKVQNHESLPIVSCIMPTYERPNLISYAIDQFLGQTYPHKELIIVDDSAESIENLIPSDSRIKYQHLPQKTILGKKRNLACELSSGEIIVHLDDDDWYSPSWIYHQVNTLKKKGVSITGLTNPYFFSPDLHQGWQYIYGQETPKWVHGATLGYWKRIWEKQPFPELRVAEDTLFLWNHKGSIIQSHTFVLDYLGRIHPHNTSPKHTAGSRWKSIDLESLGSIHHHIKIPS